MLKASVPTNHSRTAFLAFFEIRSMSKENKESVIVNARVILQEKGLYHIVADGKEYQAEPSGRMRYEAVVATDLPTVGDYVEATVQQNKATIHRLLPRTSLFVRKKAGTDRSEQLVAANIDTLFVCVSLNNDFNPRRIERYVSVAWESGATPVVLLTKCDLQSNVAEFVCLAQSVAAGVDVLTVNSVQSDGYNAVLPYLGKDKTVAFVGSSGVGKSTLINKLLGKELQETNGLRNDDKGRHTTTSRRLFALPCGAFVIDTPGMRELGMWDADDGIGKAFSDIEQLAEDCRFADCTHTCEPGCAVLQAVADGALSAARVDSYRKLLAENSYNADSESYLAAKNEKFKKISNINKKRF